MALWNGKRNWRWDDRRWRGPRWNRYPGYSANYYQHPLKWMLREFITRLVVFTILCALGLAWVKLYLLDEVLTFDF